MGYYLVRNLSMLFKDNHKPHKNIVAKVQNMIGKGAYGKVYEACDDTSCKYVMKFVTFEDPEDITNFKLEVALSKLASDHKFGPKVIGEPYICKRANSGILIMDRWDGVLEDNNEVLSDREVKGLLRVVSTMHEHGIFHGDLYARQILFKGRYPYRTFSITDYGQALPLWSKVPNTIRASDVMGLLFGGFISRDPRTHHSSLVNGADPLEFCARYVDKYFSHADQLYGIITRISSVGTRENPINVQEGVLTDLELYLVYVEILKMYETPFARRFMSKLGKKTFIYRLPWVGWSSSINKKRFNNTVISYFRRMKK